VGTGDIDARILILGITWKEMSGIFMTRSRQGKTQPYPLDRRLRGHQSRSEHGSKRKIPVPASTWNKPSHYTDNLSPNEVCYFFSFCKSNESALFKLWLVISDLVDLSRGSSIGIALGYGLDDRDSRVRVPARGTDSSLHHHVQHGSGAHPAVYPMGTRSSFPGGKAAGPWSWPLTSI
jgi:hypothetical protein